MVNSLEERQTGNNKNKQKWEKLENSIEISDWCTLGDWQL